MHRAGCQERGRSPDNHHKYHSRGCIFILCAHFCECNNLVLSGVAGDEVVKVGDDVHTDRAGQVIPDQQKLGQGDKGDNCIPAFGDKCKGGGEAAEEEESFHFLERPLR